MSEYFNDCIVYVYDTDGSPVADVKVLNHDVETNIIEVTPTPDLVDSVRYNLQILTSSVPYTCSGVVDYRREQCLIKLFHGEKKEQRIDTRYKLVGDAVIIAYIWENTAYRLHTPLNASLMDISKNGIRIRMGYNSMMVGDTIHIRLMISDTQQVFTALVVNSSDNGRESSEYGCRLVEKGQSR